MERKTVTVKYSLGHSYDEEYEKTDLFCVKCGGRNVWKEDNFEDNIKHICVMCETAFYIGGIYELDENDRDQVNQQIIRGIKTI